MAAKTSTRRERMGKLTVRVTRAMLAGAVMAGLTGCATTVTGVAVKAPMAPDDSGATVALMNTGPYATAAGKPFSTAGDDTDRQSLIESQRLGEFTIGPWEADDGVRAWPGMFGTIQIGAQPSFNLSGIFSEPMVAALRKHGYVAGFSSLRTTLPDDKQQRVLFNYVMEFPDPAAAVAAADELSAIAPAPIGAVDPAGRPGELRGHPEARTKFYDLGNGRERGESFTPYKQFVFYQTAETADSSLLDITPDNELLGLIDRQQNRIDLFTPTPPDQRPALPMDPTGNLLAKTLWAPDDSAPSNMGAWAPRAWLHFEADPVSSWPALEKAGVSAVSQRLTTIYEAKNVEGAKEISGSAIESLSSDPSFKTVDGVPGLPLATCFERVSGEKVPPTAAMSYKRVAWQFRCFAWADRYAYTAFGDTAEDARQQMAAQYRILAGE